MATAPPLADTKKPAAKPPEKTGAGKEAGAGAPAKAAEAKSPTGKAGTDKATGGGKDAKGQAGGKSVAGAQPAPPTAQQRVDRMAVRAKLPVSQPGDPVEQEADRVAEQVMRMPDPAHKGGAGASPGPGPGAGVSPRGGAAPRPAGPAATGSKPGPAPSPETPQIARAPSGPAADPRVPTVPTALLADLGGGASLDNATREFFESRMGTRLDHVRIHDGSAADDAARQVGARAFTVGSDIVFAQGQYQPQTPAGQQLLAHELVHTVQQAGAGASPKVMRTPAPAPAPAPAAAAPAGAGAGPAATFDVTEPFEVPPIKARHGGRYQAMSRARQLRRAAGASLDRHTAQRATWMSAVNPDLNRIPAAQRPTQATGFRLNLNVRGGQKTLDAPDQASFENLLKVPTWDTGGADATYQVDHVVEFQMGGPDALDNMELLNQSHNGSAGASFRFEIRDAVQRTINKLPATDPSFTGLPGAPNAKPSVADVLANRVTVFKNVTATGGHERRRTEGSSTFWSRDSIVRLEHVTSLLDDSLRDRQGSATVLSILSPTGGQSVARIPHAAAATTFNVPAAQRLALSGFRMVSVQLNAGYNSAAAGSAVGSVSAELDLGPSITVVNDPGAFPIGLHKDANADFAVKLGNDALAHLPATVDLRGASPVDLSDFRLGDGLYASAILRPTHPLLAGLQIPGRVDKGRLGIFYTLDATAAAERLRIPGIEITSASVTLGFDGERLSAGGGVEFTVRNFGIGSLQAEIDSEGNFSLLGQFQADTRLFDQASLSLWYRSTGGFGGEGLLAITNPDKIRGVRSASVNARYDNGVFSATGTVVPNIPAVENASLGVRYGPDESGADTLVISGDLTVAAGIPGLRGGTVHAEVEKGEAGWKVAATGQLQPDIPGVTSQLEVAYDDGAFTASFSGAFTRGMIAGNATVGVTNRSIDEQGNASGPPAGPDAPVVVYGQGSATLRIAPWLQATAGLRFSPTGEVTVSGEIGLPGQIELFGRQEIDKRLFSVATQIPIVPGIVAEVGGNLTAKAGIGPGQLDQLRIGVEYNPEREEDTRVSGDAHVNVPADAGLRLAARAGIGLGITGASATGGIELGGSLGIDGAAEAGVHVDWTPRQGLNLEAEAAFHAQPKFKFDVSGYVAVTALGVSVYDNRWELAAYELGSDLRFGVRFPVRYREGEPFSVSLDDVQFEVPDVDPGAMIDQLAGELF